MLKTMRYITLSVLSLMALSGCGVLDVGPATQVPLSSAGLEMTLDQLRAEQDKYSIHYSLNSQSPPGVVFIPKDSPYTLQLIDRGINRWYEAETPELVTQVIRRIKDNRFGGTRFPSVQAIVTPSKGPDNGRRDLLAYIYSRGYASLTEVEGEQNTYALLPVPPQKNLKFNNLDEGMGGGGNK